MRAPRSSESSARAVVLDRASPSHPRAPHAHTRLRLGAISRPAEKRELIADISGKQGATYGEKGGCRRIPAHARSTPPLFDTPRARGEARGKVGGKREHTVRCTCAYIFRSVRSKACLSGEV